MQEKMKFNPFRPGSIVRPGMFSGRHVEIGAIEKCLFQTKFSNPQNFLVVGERGIGKSSLMLFAESVAKGDVTYTLDHSLKFLVLSVELREGMSALDLIRLIGKKFKSELNLRSELKAKAETVWKFITNWEVLGVKYNSQEEVLDPVSISDELAEKFKEVIDASEGEIDGIAIYIDEADKASEATKLGETLKLLDEKLTKLGCEKIIIGLAGLTELRDKLKESHESSTRIFQILELRTLEPADRKKVVNLGLEDANKKNDVKTTITEEALDRISELSEGYPHFIQQFAYSAFEEDKDNIIDLDDVERGAFSRNGALEQLGHKYFQENYYKNIGSDDYRKVLEAMAEYDDKWVTRATLLEEFKGELTENTVDNGLKSLKNKGIILLDPANRGVYKIPTKSFATWIKIKALSREVQPKPNE